MHKLYELIVPSWAEVLLYLVFSLALLVILNAADLWNALLRSAGTDQATDKSINGGLHQLIAHVTTLSDPQLVNAFVWGATAALGLFIAVAIGGFLHATKQDAAGLQNRRSGVGFIESLLIRLSAVGGFIIAALFSIFGLLPVWSQLFVANLTHLSDRWSNGLSALCAWLGVAFAAYCLAILCRLATLRIRVFSSVID